MILKIFLLLNIIASSVSFTVPPRHFNHWHCINLEKNIDKTQPYKYNIGDLSLITYFNDTKPMTVLNTQTNMTKLKLGKTVIHDNKLWWSYKPKYKLPPTAPYLHNRNYATETLKFEISGSVTDYVYNSICMNYLNYNNAFKNMKNMMQQNRPTIIYQPGKIKIMNKHHNISISNIYQAPYTIWTQVKLSNNQRLVLYANLLPLEKSRTQCIITIKYNRHNETFNKLLTDMISFFERNKYKFLHLLNIYMAANKQLGTSKDVNIKNILDIYEYPDTEKVIQLYYYISNKNKNKHKDIQDIS